MNKSIGAGLALALLLAGCGGGGGATGSSLPYTPSGGGSNNSNNGLAVGPASIATTNAVGTTLHAFTEFENGQQGASAGFMVGRDSASPVRMLTSGACTNGVILYVPDKNHDAFSTEVQDFYDTACKSIARDTVRIWGSTVSNAEQVTTTEKQFAFGNSKIATATRSDVTNYASDAFDAHGYPSLMDGFTRSSTGFLTIGSSKTIISDYDLVMGPQQTSGKGGAPFNTYCSDSAGFSLVAVDTNDGLKFQSYGWGSIINDGVRTVNGNGTVTWTGTHDGTDYAGEVGQVGVSVGPPATACPITNPMYVPFGPNGSLSTRTIPVAAIYTNGVLTSLTITNATLANGVQLNVVTNAGNGPGSSQFITGTLLGANEGPSGTPIAVFNVDAFGDGTLTVNWQGGQQYTITDWHVSHNPAIL